jgi:ParB-like chromosome segregation protein Spo0J
MPSPTPHNPIALTILLNPPKTFHRFWHMPAIATPDNKAQRKLFHNEWINVYPTTLPLNKIHYWPNNNRTIFTFERLCRLKKKELKKIPLEEITRFVAEQDIHKLQVLADSIGRNGVQVPLVIRDDGKLLDGNRRYFACHWLKMQCTERGKPLPESLSQIPVQVIRKADLTDTLELKILAEANFIPDLKVAWPLDAQARAVEEYYQRFQKEKKADEETALAEVVAVFGISRQRAVDLLDTLELTKQFIAAGSSADDKIRRREIVEDKFVYLWEFRNKAMKGSGALDAATELGDVKDIFFQFMAKGRDNPIKNVKQVEPLVQAKRDPTAWSLLKESKGAKLSVVVSMMNEKKEVRKAEDKIRVFLAWLKEVKDLTPKAKGYLREVAELAAKKSR